MAPSSSEIGSDLKPNLVHLQSRLLDDRLHREAHRAVLDEAIGGQEVCGVQISAHQEVGQNLWARREQNVWQPLDVGPRHVGPHLGNPHLKIKHKNTNFTDELKNFYFQWLGLSLQKCNRLLQVAADSQHSWTVNGATSNTIYFGAGFKSQRSKMFSRNKIGGYIKYNKVKTTNFGKMINFNNKQSFGILEIRFFKILTLRSFLASLASFLSVGLMIASPENGLTVRVASSSRTWYKKFEGSNALK